MCVNKLFFELNNNLILFIFFSFFFNIEQSYEYATSYRFKCQSNTHKESNESRYTMFQRRNNKDNRKKKKKNWTSTSACRLCCIIIVTREYSTFVIFWYIILRMLDSDGHLSRLWIYDRWSSQRSHRHRFAIYYADTFNNFLCEP